MVSISWPPMQDLLANPSKYGPYFTTPGPDGYSIVSRMKAFPSEAALNYRTAQNQVQTQVERANQEIYNTMNSGAAANPNSNQTKTVQYWLDNVQGIVKGMAPAIVNGTVPKTAAEAFAGPVKDTQGSQVVDKTGAVLTPSQRSDATTLGKTPPPTDPTLPTSAGGYTYGQPITLPSGQRVDPSNPAYADVARNMGIGPGGTTPTGQPDTNSSDNGAPTDPNAPNMSGWTQEQIDTYGAAKGYAADLAQQGKMVNPNIDITPEMAANWLQQAKADYAPYYAQKNAQGQQDVKNNLSDIGSTLASSERDIGSAFSKNIDATQQNFASRGLEFSSDRNKAEADVTTSANNALGKAETTAMQQSRDAGINAERSLGTSGLGDATSQSANFGAKAAVNGPGSATVSGGSSRQLFAPTGNTLGTNQADQTTAELDRVNSNKAEYQRTLSSFYT